MRKYHFGAASVLLGAALVLGGGQVAADEPSASNNIKVVVTQTADEDAPTSKKGQKSQSQHQLLK
ncbi:YSIRK-type signal peptide-containing protein [Streptococcus alactolyticus]|uniref:YSIRK-type signal peptide-containing protein n=1 Tax=Streptococcus alactolyticus TaxID=29389 RepID=UPI003AF4F81D